MNKVTGQR